MRKFALVLLLGLVAALAVPSTSPVHAAQAALSTSPVQVQTCSPRGYDHWGFYDWIANGEPVDSSCWSREPTRTAFVTGTTACGWTSPAWELYNGGWIKQTFTIPTTMTSQYFSIMYFLDFDDPHNDGASNRFIMRVQDITTGAMLAQESFNGFMGDQYCVRHDQEWNANLVGHTITVSFLGSRGYSDTHIRVRLISLFQNPW